MIYKIYKWYCFLFRLLSVDFFLVVFLYLIYRVSAYVVGQSPSLIAQSVRPDAKLVKSDPGNCLWRRVVRSVWFHFDLNETTRRLDGSSNSITMYVCRVK